MSRAKTNMLQRAFVAEIDAAFNGAPGILQTKSKIADALVDDGMLRKVTIPFGGRFPVYVTGYELTHAGRMAFCMTCKDVDEEAEA